MFNYLCIANGGFKGSLTGIGIGAGLVTPAQKVWLVFQAIGDIAFAYSYSMILIEIQVSINFMISSSTLTFVFVSPKKKKNTLLNYEIH